MSDEAGARRLTGAALKSFAHPLRLRIYELLQEHGPLTATKLAGLLGENTGATSYHLRELARHEMIEPAEGIGRGKEKYWRIARGGYSSGAPWKESDPGSAAAAQVLIDRTLALRAEELATWQREAPHTSEEWVGAGSLTRFSVRLTAEETRALSEEVQRVLTRYRAMAEDREPPEGAARVVMHFDIFPTGMTSAE